MDGEQELEALARVRCHFEGHRPPGEVEHHGAALAREPDHLLPYLVRGDRRAIEEDVVPGDRGRRVDALHRPAAEVLESGPEHGVSVHERLPRPRQRVEIHVADQHGRGESDVVEGALRLQLVHVPLGELVRRELVVLGRRQAGKRGARLVTAEPDRRQRGLQRRSGRQVRPLWPLRILGRRGQCPAIDLAVRQERQRLELHEGRRGHHIGHDVRPEQPLTAAGVDSLAAVELAADVEQHLGVHLTLTRFLDPTPLADIAAEIASDIDASIAERAAEVTPPPVRDVDVATAAVSDGQEALSFLARLDPESAAYNVALVARIHPPLDVAALQRALQILVDRHGELQATFPAGDGSGSVHKALRPFALHVPVVDARACSDEALLARLRHDANAPFDLARGPLVRAALYQRDGGEHILLLAVHHVVVDLWSLVLLLAELRELYPAGDASALPPAPGYARYLARQRDVLAPAHADRLWAYWRARMAGPLPILALPTERPRDATPTSSGAMHTFTIDAETTRGLRQLAQRHGATLYMALLAAYQVLLARHARQSDVLVGAPASGRTSAELMGVVGYLANTVVLRADLSDDPAFATVLERARDEVRGALEHQDLPFSHLVEALAPRAARGLSPLFQAAFVMERPHRHRELAPFILGHPQRRLRWGALDVETLPFDQGTTQFELTLNVVEGEDELAAAFQFATDLYARPSIERMARHFVELIRGAVAAPDRRVSELPLLGAAERLALVGAWSRGPEEAPERCLHDLSPCRSRERRTRRP